MVVSGENVLVSYIIEVLFGIDVIMVKLYMLEGVLVEMGFVCNGKKNGIWFYFNGEIDFFVKVISFVDDMYNGSYMEFNDCG